MCIRDSSIASHPENKKYFEFVIRWVRKPYPGRLTTAMFNLKEGDPIQWRKANGTLTINDKLPNGEPDERRIVCIGGGTGLAPFVVLLSIFMTLEINVNSLFYTEQVTLMN